MLVVKQSYIGANTLIKLQLLITFLITDLSRIQANLPNSSPINTIKEGTINKTIDAPSQFPESKNYSQELPILQLDTLLNNTNKTVIDKINRAIKNHGKDKLPTEVSVILNNSDTSNPDTHINNGNADSNSYVEISTEVVITASEQKNENSPWKKNEISKKSTIIFLVSVSLVSIFFYVLLVSLRKILERKYGDRELLVQSEIKNEDYC